MRVLRQEKFYLNMKKCSFMTSCVVFLGLVVSSKGVEPDTKKVKSYFEVA